MEHIFDEKKYVSWCIEGQTSGLQASSISELASETGLLLEECKQLILSSTVKHATSWVLEKNVVVGSEKKIVPVNTTTLSRGRVVNVNPGALNVGHEQRYPHAYIVLGEYEGIFIGVPITNMAYNKITKKHYTRHYFEVPLEEITSRKQEYFEYKIKKPSVADIRNISGLDKRRILKTRLWDEAKYAPREHLDAISNKIRASIAIIRD